MDARVAFQCIEIGEIADVAQQYYGYVDLAPLRRGALGGQCNGVFFFDVDVVVVGDHTQHGNAAEVLEHLPSLFKEPQVAAEFVDEDAFDVCPLFGPQQHDGSVYAGEDAAAVDVANQKDVGARVHGHGHVDQVAVAQVDLGEAAGPFHHDGVMSGGQAVVRGVDGFAKFGPTFLAEVVVGIAVADGLSVEHDLGSVVALRLEQQGIHIGMAGHSGGFGLHGLGAADLQALGGGEGVQGHVLGLERSGVIAVLPEDAAERGGEDALADVAAGAGQHHGMESFLHGWFL